MTQMSPGLEALQFEFDGQRPVGLFRPVLVGVLGSGNLEVLMEPDSRSGCRFRIDTSARGFGGIWEAVLRDFQSRHTLSGVSVAIHDMGATPAVVSLRLEQAVREMQP